ncbi:hypothetical protein [Streptomyces wuyuanensis]|uniref:hypothetical protein n=1 Tax=Streptomyces wuyuanensis TaxID=1196353 RepID=UPI003448CD1B
MADQGRAVRAGLPRGSLTAVAAGPAAAVPPGSDDSIAGPGSDTVSVIDTAGNTVAAAVPVGNRQCRASHTATGSAVAAAEAVAPRRRPCVSQRCPPSEGAEQDHRSAEPDRVGPRGTPAAGTTRVR